jgi:formate dehydrogenase subunit delta
LKPDKLTFMANQIAAFFRPYPAEAARAGIKAHVQAFWTPAMRATMQAYLQAGGAGVDSLVAEALRIPDQAQPGEDTLIDRAASPVREAGEMATDAG